VSTSATSHAPQALRTTKLKVSFSTSNCVVVVMCFLTQRHDRVLLVAFSPLRQWARANLDDPTWEHFASSRDELQESLALHGLERVDSSKAPMYRSAPMRKQAAAQMIGDFRLRVNELEKLARDEAEAKARAEQVVRQSTSEDTVVDAQTASVQAQIALMKQS
jgi:hypothetical protein